MSVLRAEVWPAVLFVVSSAAVVFTAWRCGNALAGAEARPAHRTVVILVCGLGEMVAVLQLLGLVNLLSRLPIAVVAVAGAVVAARFVTPPPVELHPWRSGLAARLVVVAVCAGLVGFGVMAGLGGRSTEADTVSYHAPNAGSWVHDHDLWSLPYSNAGYFTNAYPSNGELSGVWFLAPTGSDQLVYTQNVLWGALALAGVALIAEELRGRASPGVFAGAALAAAPIVLATQVHSMMTDLAATSGLVAAVGLLLAARRRPGSWTPFLLAGVAAGLSTGSKYTAFVPAVLLALFALALFRGSARWRSLGGLAAGGASLTLLWLLRDWVLIGNPLYPEPVSIAGHQIFTGGQTPLTSYATSMLAHLVQLHAGPLATWRHTAWLEYGPALALLALGVVGAAVLARRDRTFALTGALAVTWFVAYLAVPYTGGGPDGTAFMIGSQLRYALPFAFLAVALAAATLPKVVTALLGAVCVGWGVWKVKQGPGFRGDLQLTASLTGEVAVIVVLVTAAAALAFSERGRSLVARGAWRRIEPLTAAPGELGAVRPSRLAAGGVVLLVAIAGVATLLHHRPAAKTWAERRLDAAGVHGPVAVVAVGDVRDLMGASFDIPLESTGIGGATDEIPPLTAAALDAKIAELDPAALAVGAGPQAVEPPGYTAPPGWTRLASNGAVTLWLPPAP